MIKLTTQEQIENLFMYILSVSIFADALGVEVSHLEQDETNLIYGNRGLKLENFKFTNNTSELSKLLLNTIRATFKEESKNLPIEDIHEAYLSEKWEWDELRIKTDNPAIPTIKHPANNYNNSFFLVRIPAVIFFHIAKNSYNFEKVGYDAARLSVLTNGHPLATLSNYFSANLMMRLLTTEFFLIPNSLTKTIYKAMKDTIHFANLNFNNNSYINEFEKCIFYAIWASLSTQKGSREVIELIGDGTEAHHLVAIVIYLLLRYKRNLTACLEASVNNNGAASVIGMGCGMLYAAMDAKGTGDIIRLNKEISLEVKQIISEITNE